MRNIFQVGQQKVQVEMQVLASKQDKNMEVLCFYWCKKVDFMMVTSNSKFGAMLKFWGQKMLFKECDK